MEVPTIILIPVLLLLIANLYTLVYLYLKLTKDTVSPTGGTKAVYEVEIKLKDNLSPQLKRIIKASKKLSNCGISSKDLIDRPIIDRTTKPPK